MKWKLKKKKKNELESFMSMINGENDMRFVFCASVISYILNDFSGINREKTLNFIKNSQCYDGAFGMGPDLEGHGGATYVAVVSLVLLDGLNLIDRDSLLRWCLFNQGHGFKGRPNKPEDSCCSFWVGAVTKIARYVLCYKL